MTDHDTTLHIDPVLVDRVCRGGREGKAAYKTVNRREREEIVASLWSDGLSDGAIHRRTGMAAETVCRVRQRMGLRALAPEDQIQD